MRMIELKGNKYLVKWTSPIKEQWLEIKDKIAAIPGRSFSKTEGVWTIPVNAGTTVELAGIAETYEFTVHEGAAHQMNEMAGRSLKMIQLALGEVEVTNNFGMKKELRSYQKTGVQYGLLAKSFILADTPGSGKSIIALSIVDYQKKYPLLIITSCENKSHWKGQWEDFTGRKSVSIWDKSGQRGKGDVDIIDWEMLSKVADYIKNYRQYEYVIFDRGCKERSSRRMITAIEIASKIPYRIVISDSPEVNSIKTLSTQLALIGQVSLFGNEFMMLSKFTNVNTKQFSKQDRAGNEHLFRVTDYEGVINEKILYATLKANCFIGRKRSEIECDLPLITEQFIDIPCSDLNYVIQIKQHTKSLRIIYDKLDGIRENSLQAEVLYEQADKIILLLQQMSALAKLQGIRDWVNGFLQSSEKILLYTVNSEVQTEMFSWFNNCATILQEQSEDQAQGQIDRFVSDNNCRVMVVSRKSDFASLIARKVAYIGIVEPFITERPIEMENECPITVYNLMDMDDGSVDQVCLKTIEAKKDLSKINSTAYFMEKYLNE